MHAQDAVYHTTCLVALYNRYRQINKPQKQTVDKDRCSNEALALAELANYIETAKCDKDKSVIYKLSDLSTVHSERLKQLDPTNEPAKVNSTRLKNRLLALIPDLRSQNKGKNVFMVYQDDLSNALKQACDSSQDSDASLISKVAQIIRKEILSKQEKNVPFAGKFSDTYQQGCIPNSLCSLLRMILADTKHDIGEIGLCEDDSVDVAVRSLSQLISYNVIGSRRKKTQSSRHETVREQPLPMYIGIMIHASTRKKKLVDKLHKLGLSISYDRIKQISAKLVSTVCTQFEHDPVVTPLNMLADVFTTAAVDNIDYNPSSTTAKDSFHGTAISLTNHVTSENTGRERVRVIQDPDSDSSTTRLSPSYTVVKPVTLGSADVVVPSVDGNVRPNGQTFNAATDDEDEWLGKISEAVERGFQEGDEKLHWSAFHSAKVGDTDTRPKATIGLLPLFRDSANSPAMIMHALKVIQDVVEFLNPGRVPVIAFDQPLFSLAKQIQWKFPDHFGEQRSVIMLGGMHVEMAFMSVIGQWLSDSGWTDILQKADMATSGRCDSLTAGKKLKQSRYAHQVTMSALQVLQQRAYNASNSTASSAEAIPTFCQWHTDSASNHPQFHFWNTVLELVMLLNVFVRALRSGNFHLYIDCLDRMVPWFFALNHIHYSRWLPVHVRDMVQLEHIHPSVYVEFVKGKFVVQRSTHKFSMMSLDQSHEHSNKVIKGDGGAVGITECPTAFERWMLVGPEFARLVSEFENVELPEISDHHESSQKIQQTFLKDVIQLVAVFEDVGNPFMEDSTDLYRIDNMNCMPIEIVKSIQCAHSLGSEKHTEFVTKRLSDKDDVPLSDTINKLSLHMFSNPPRKRTKFQDKTSALKSNCNLYSNLYIACQVRDGDLEQFFRHENQLTPPSLACQGKLRTGTKSDLLSCLELHKSLDTPEAEPSVTMIVLDGAAIVNMVRPKTPSTFAEYADNIFIPHVLSLMSNVERLDLVWDRYLEKSLKYHTRERRGDGDRRRISEKGFIPRNWPSFLRNSRNKEELFAFLSERLMKINLNEKQLYIIQDKGVTTPSGNTDGIDPCDHEEADSCMLLHVFHGTHSGHKNITIRTVDTDVVVLAVACVTDLGLSQLWIAFGVGKHYRLIPAQEIASSLGPDRCRALPGFHAVTGSDTTSSMSGRGKKSAWEIWESYPELTRACMSISQFPPVTDEDIMGIFERFVVLLYSKTSDALTVNEARRMLFPRRRSLESIPPTLGALTEHIKRSAFQAGFVWGQATVALQNLSSELPLEWGWKDGPDGYEPLWTMLPQASEACHELIHCGCKKSCRKLCKCNRAHLSCTELCSCRGTCYGVNGTDISLP